MEQKVTTPAIKGAVLALVLILCSITLYYTGQSENKLLGFIPWIIFAGVIICLVCAVSFLMGVVDKMFISHTSDVMNSTIGFATLGAGLLGVRKFMQNKTSDVCITPDKHDDTPEVKGSADVDNPDV